MPARSERQAALVAALRDPAVVPPGIDAPSRFAVHRNTVAAALAGALGDSFPAVRALVGEAFFRAAARDFAAAHPPRSPALMFWGDAFPDWIGAFPPAAGLPYLRDVARLDWAWLRAWHAAEAPPVPLAALGAVAPDRLDGLRLALHPSVALIASAHPVASLWAEVTGRAPRSALDLARPETALVARPAAAVEVRVAPPPTAAFLAALLAGRALGEAAAACPDLDLAAELGALFAGGLVVALRPADPPKSLPEAAPWTA